MTTKKFSSKKKAVPVRKAKAQRHAARKAAGNPSFRRHRRRQEVLWIMKRLDGEDLTPRDIAGGLSAHLELVSAHRRKKHYNETYVRMSMEAFNRLCDHPLNRLSEDDYRDQIIAAGKDEGIVIGIGDNAVIITHDS